MGYKCTENVVTLPSEMIRNEQTTAEDNEFIMSGAYEPRENFTKPIQETNSFTTQELVC